uniref:CAPA-Periviscerokinin-1 n=1 Tax=Pachyphasma brandbergense TaxID=1041430 RepID=PVK1_PACBA|nr:RecName: Full=CAPA-Periviscerokinin-1; Short=CAPA-PVK-1 [Pachyphasma brandbergense]
EAAGLLAFPRT